MNNIYFKSAETMREVLDNSAQLVICSPPYSENSILLEETSKRSKEKYMNLLYKVFNESFRVLKKDGLLVTISTDEKKNGEIWSKNADIIRLAISNGFKYFDQIIWKKTEISLYRIPYSQINFFKKQGKLYIAKNDELNRIFLTKIWDIKDSQYRKDSKGFIFRSAFHPLIAERILLRYSKSGDLIINPFTGSGTVPKVANQLERSWIGYEVNKELKLMINENINGI